MHSPEILSRKAVLKRYGPLNPRVSLRVAILLIELPTLIGGCLTCRVRRLQLASHEPQADHRHAGACELHSFQNPVTKIALRIRLHRPVYLNGRRWRVLSCRRSGYQPR